jgi:cytochrome d ubiquinol oxidase subunit I
MAVMFEGWDAGVLARAQFAFTMSFHIVFPAFSIGLASYLAVLEALWLWTAREVFINLFNYWLKIFAIAFGMGVVSGIVMSYQFGTNWSVFSDKAGPIVGPLMAYEVLTAFFLEAGFLGVMLFGLERVGHRLHFMATVMVAIGTLISAFWILSANSWMQTPAGYAVNAEGQFVAASWLNVIFNPSFPYRLVHMVLAAYLTTALVVGAVGAFHLRRDSHLAGPRVMFSMAMWMATLVAPIQILAGDQQGLNTLAHQPAKVMAMEGHFQSHKEGAPLILFGLPDQAAGKVRFAVEIPKLSSLILKHSIDAPLDGLDSVPRQNWPPVPILFWTFRIMVGLGFLIMGLGLFSLCERWRGKLYQSRLLLLFAMAMGPAGFVAVLAGWFTTETGRQPFTIFGLLRTAESVSPLASPAVASSLVAFVIVYFTVFSTGVIYILRLMGKPPHHGEQGPQADIPARAAGITPAAAAASARGAAG